MQNLIAYNKRILYLKFFKLNFSRYLGMTFHSCTSSRFLFKGGLLQIKTIKIWKTNERK